MRRNACVPMILLLLLLTACGEAEKMDTGDRLREPFQSMTGCTMEAEISCAYENLLWTGQLHCDYVPDGECSVEVLAPQTIAGVRALEKGSFRSDAMEAVCAAYARNRELGK